VGGKASVEATNRPIGLILLHHWLKNATHCVTEGACQSTRRLAARWPAIRLQAQGENLDPFRMDRILALDERLTRQLEKTLTMLVRLEEMRRRAVKPVQG
jgi:hypothetical protein